MSMFMVGILGRNRWFGKGRQPRLQAGRAGSILSVMRGTVLSLLLVLVMALPGCERLRAPDPSSAITDPAGQRPRARDEAAAAAARIVAPGPGARSAAAFDRTTEADKAAALATSADGRVLGTLVVSLGNPAEQGFWLRSGLVSREAPGTVRMQSGAAVQVTLRPLAGGGAQLSLAAYRALGLGLTDLPEVTVLAR